jgi:hypothetical protein
MVTRDKGKNGGDTMERVTPFPKGIDDALAQGIKPKAKDPNKVWREVSKIANLAPEEAKLVSLAVEIWNQPLPPNEKQRRLNTEVVEPLAKLPRASRVTVVKAISKELDLSRTEVKELLGDFERRQNPKTENEETLWEKVEPYPEPVLLQQVLNDLCEYISTYVVLERYYVDILALWTIMTWVYEKFAVVPFLLVNSPVHRAGKSTLVENLYRVVRRGILTSNVTTAVLFRLVDTYHPTLLFDEADTLLKDNEDLTSIVNVAYKKSGVVWRVNTETKKLENFQCFAPIALAGNNPQMAIPTRDRCIEIKLKRKLPGEKCESAEWEIVENHANQIKPHIARAVLDITPLLEELLKKASNIPELQDLKAHNSRAYDIAKPLVRLAQLADLQAYGRIVEGGWFERAVTAIKETYKNKTENEGKRETLLRDIKTVFDQTQQEALPSKELLTKLKQLDESPWDDLSERTLAKMLKPFEVKPKVMRFNEKEARGYLRQSFDDPWKRYL